MKNPPGSMSPVSMSTRAANSPCFTIEQSSAFQNSPPQTTSVRPSPSTTLATRGKAPPW